MPSHKSLKFIEGFNKMLSNISDIDKDIAFKGINKDKKDQKTRQVNTDFYNLISSVGALENTEDHIGKQRYKQHLQNEYGFKGLGKRDDGFQDDIFVKDIQRFAPGMKAFTTSGTDENRIIMSERPNPLLKDYTKQKHDYDAIYAHELVHQRRNVLEDTDTKAVNRAEKNLPWHERSEENIADYGALEVLGKNLKRAGMENTAQTGRDWIMGETKSENIIKNPSMAPFKDRLEFLPVAKSDRDYTMINSNWRDITNPTVTTTKDFSEFKDWEQENYDKSIAKGLYNKDVNSKFAIGTKKKRLLWNRQHTDRWKSRDELSKTLFSD